MSRLVKYSQKKCKLPHTTSLLRSFANKWRYTLLVIVLRSLLVVVTASFVSVTVVSAIVIVFFFGFCVCTIVHIWYINLCNMFRFLCAISDSGLVHDFDGEKFYSGSCKPYHVFDRVHLVHSYVVSHIASTSNTVIYTFFKIFLVLSFIFVVVGDELL